MSNSIKVNSSVNSEKQLFQHVLDNVRGKEVVRQIKNAGFEVLSIIINGSDSIKLQDSDSGETIEGFFEIENGKTIQVFAKRVEKVIENIPAEANELEPGLKKALLKNIGQSGGTAKVNDDELIRKRKKEELEVA